MLIFSIALFILGGLLLWVAKKLATFARAIEEEHQSKKQYEEDLLNSVRNIETEVCEKSEDHIKDTVDAIQRLKQHQRDQENVDKLLDELDK